MEEIYSDIECFDNFEQGKNTVRAKHRANDLHVTQWLIISHSFGNCLVLDLR